MRYLELQKASLLFNLFMLTNFSYCSFISIFCGIATNNIVSRVHERALRALLSDYDSIFDDIVRRNEEVIIHETYAKAYAGSMEVYDLSAPLIWHRTMKDL